MKNRFAWLDVYVDNECNVYEDNKLVLPRIYRRGGITYKGKHYSIGEIYGMINNVTCYAIDESKGFIDNIVVCDNSWFKLDIDGFIFHNSGLCVKINDCKLIPSVSLYDPIANESFDVFCFRNKQINKKEVVMFNPIKALPLECSVRAYFAPVVASVETTDKATFKDIKEVLESADFNELYTMVTGDVVKTTCGYGNKTEILKLMVKTFMDKPLWELNETALNLLRLARKRTHNEIGYKSIKELF